MRLRRLELERSPGLGAPLLLEDLSPGFNVVVGPNGSGKSSLCRAVAGLLWETEEFRGAARATWSLADGELDVRRETGVPPQWAAGEARPPALPDGVYRGCFSFSVDDFLVDAATEGEIHRVIRTELSAGFDLARVLADRRRHGASHATVASKRNELVVAGRKVEGLRQTHRDLWQKEKNLDERRAALEEARRARDGAGLYSQALDLARERDALRMAELELEAFPQGMSRLHGDEQRQLESFEAKRADAEQEQEEAEAARAAATAELREIGLADGVPAESLKLLAERESQLRELERDLSTAASDEAQAAATIQECRQALRHLGAADSGAAPGPESLQELESTLAELQRHEALRDSDEARAAVTAPPVAEEGERGEALALLARWLEEGGGSGGPLRLAALGSVLIGVALVFLALADALALGAALGLGAALVLFGAGGWLLRDRGAARARRQADFAGLGLAPPARWQVAEVTARLRELQAELASLEEGRARARAAEEARVQLERSAARCDELVDRFEAHALACGLDPATARSGVVRIVQELGERAAASGALARAQARKVGYQAEHARLLESLATDFEAFGLEAPGDARELGARRDALAQLDTRRRQARSALEAADGRLERVEREATRRQADLEAFLEERGLAGLDGAELEQQLEQREAWSAVRGDHEQAAREVARLEQALERHPELARLDAEGAQRRLNENAELAEACDALQEEVVGTAQSIQAARRGHELEEALAEEERARERLGESRQELFEAAAAEFLIDDVARDHRSLAQPGLLQEVGRLFASFTRHRYELRSATSLEATELPFEIHETGGGAKAFGELSSGTRSQLGLALRLAVARSVEMGESLPLVLDEALTNSDPERFQDVVRSLLELVRQGRQVLFLTADDADAERLEAVLADEGYDATRRFDLGSVGREARRIPSAATERLPAVPAPAPGQTAADYAQVLGVPKIEPFAPTDALHLFYLCSDDLEGLHEVLRERVETVGRTRRLLAAQPDVWRPERRARFEALAAVAAAWFESWRLGRAPRLTPEVLREGPVGTTKFVEDLVDIASELEGDGAALIELLGRPAKERDGRLKGFRRSKLEELERDLEERGFFSVDPRDDVGARLERCLAAAQSAVAAGALAREDVVQLAHAFEQWVDA